MVVLSTGEGTGVDAICIEGEGVAVMDGARRVELAAPWLDEESAGDWNFELSWKRESVEEEEAEP